MKWQPIKTAPKNPNKFGAGKVVRLKGFDKDHPRRTTLGFWLHSEGIWAQCVDGPDGEALSSYADEKEQYGPTHWQPEK
jgi:hypothetical protein